MTVLTILAGASFALTSLLLAWLADTVLVAIHEDRLP